MSQLHSSNKAQHALFAFRESCNEALDVMVENVTVLKAMQVVVGGGFGHKSVVVRTNVARLVDKVVTQLGAERVMGSSKEFQASLHFRYPSYFSTLIMGYWAHC